MCIEHTVWAGLYLSLPFCVNTGVLIVSVQWRNKTFSGSLIDMNQHEWAPPRYIYAYETKHLSVNL